MRPDKTTEKWRGILEEWRASGLTLNAFANERGVNAKTLEWWRRELKATGTRRAATATTFASLTLSPPTPPPTTSETSLRLRFERHAVVLDIADHASVALVRAIVEVLC